MVETVKKPGLKKLVSFTISQNVNRYYIKRFKTLQEIEVSFFAVIVYLKLKKGSSTLGELETS